MSNNTVIFKTHSFAELPRGAKFRRNGSDDIYLKVGAPAHSICINLTTHQEETFRENERLQIIGDSLAELVQFDTLKDGEFFMYEGKLSIVLWVTSGTDGDPDDPLVECQAWKTLGSDSDVDVADDALVRRVSVTITVNDE